MFPVAHRRRDQASRYRPRPRKSEAGSRHTHRAEHSPDRASPRHRPGRAPSEVERSRITSRSSSRAMSCGARSRCAAILLRARSSPLTDRAPSARRAQAQRRRGIAPTRPAGRTEICSRGGCRTETRAHRPPGRELLQQHGLGEDRPSVGAGQMAPPHDRPSQRERADREQHPTLDGERRHEKPAQRFWPSAAAADVCTTTRGRARRPHARSRRGDAFAEREPGRQLQGLVGRRSGVP